ncbi:hypothetical protein THF1C08_320113 [Vibrio jasicida]|uniref:Uncharacterized protein n=1 Tax=Vibrio jasicida TaxID=766224 RepID=A0AAU9QQ92_9VIBR|nr:hypothetical protein THF1C08_320113 [Vibrio jasicida]CAH1597598.1 hypothetical protein THF1A12_320114 [Vibrio jasicida]
MLRIDLRQNVLEMAVPMRSLPFKYEISVGGMNVYCSVTIFYSHIWYHYVWTFTLPNHLIRY